MTFALLLNILTIMCCLAVLVQSVRLMQRLRTMRDGSLQDMVSGLDRATAAARAVLQDLRSTLVDDRTAHTEAARHAAEIRDELVVLVGIGNSVAERITEAADKARQGNPSETVPDADGPADASDAPTPAESSDGEAAA